MTDNFTPNPLITRQIMQDYEVVRRSGRANMFDLAAVFRAAVKLHCVALARITRDAILEWDNGDSLYMQILKNFSSYMKMHDIRQPKEQSIRRSK